MVVDVVVAWVAVMRPVVVGWVVEVTAALVLLTPASCCWTVELNVPDIPAKVNLAEKERYGFPGDVGLVRVREEKRMKYMLPFGPIVGSTVNWIAWMSETLIGVGNAIG